MPTLQTLKRQARKSAAFRGHDLTPFRFTGHGLTALRDAVVVAHCRRCGSEVQVEVIPAPNSINIAGEAVAVTCASRTLAMLREIREDTNRSLS
jgi:superfamily II helicase